MKKIVLALMALAMVSFVALPPTLSKEDRKATAKELKATQKRLVKVVKGLSNAQLNFKPSPEAWSVAECVEHLAISEGMIGGMLKKALETPADASKRDSVKMSDQQLMGIITSREQKVKTSKPFEPSGKFGSHTETLQAFLDGRNKHIKYIKGTDDDLRNHFGQLPFGTIDGVQILLFMSGHTERHVSQMEEVMAHTDFPKS